MICKRRSVHTVRDFEVRPAGDRVWRKHFCLFSCMHIIDCCTNQRHNPVSSLCHLVAESLSCSLLALEFNEPDLQKLSKQTALLTRQSFAFSGPLARGSIMGSVGTGARNGDGKHLKIEPWRTRLQQRALDAGCLETDASMFNRRRDTLGWYSWLEEKRKNFF